MAAVVNYVSSDGYLGFSCQSPHQSFQGDWLKGWGDN